VRNRGIIVFAAGLLAALGAGWLGFPKVLYQRTPQPLQFSHAVHTGEKAGMKCEDCHSLREDGSFSGIPAVAQCAGCHSAPLGTTAAEKQLVEHKDPLFCLIACNMRLLPAILNT
jgi:cytochrome c553